MKRRNIPLSKIPINHEIKKSVISVLDDGNFILGKQTQDFETQFAKFCNVKYAACVNSGTAALFLALKGFGVKKGDEIIVPSLSFIASATPILMCGAKPKFVEINEENYTIDPLKIENLISKKTRGIIPVHLYGHPTNMDPIKKIAKDNSLFVLEDAAQAHGSKYKGKSVGSIGDAACFSFYPSKNLTVCGDGGIVISNNQKLITEIKRLRNHGRSKKYIHEILGYNFRFNEIQAAIGKIMLKNLNEFNSNRRKIAKYYSDVLKDIVIIPKEEKWAKHVFHMYTIRTKKRDWLKDQLLKVGISTGIHYPVPIHKQPLFKKYSKKKLPFTETVCKTTLSLPMFSSLDNNDMEYVAQNVKKFLMK